MGGWIGIGLGAAAALCPLPQHGDTTITMDHTPVGDRLVVCAPDVWIDMSHGRSNPEPEPPPSPRPPAPSPPAPAPEPSAPRPAPTAARRVTPPVATPTPSAPVAESVSPADPVPGTAPARPRAPRTFRWVPRSHYTGGPSRPVPAGMPTTMTTVVVTLPAVLAAAALRPGSRRRNRG